ncbi:MAG: 5,10-methylene tetrahydromethanopterin reductase [Acidobacteria bacterium]|jgi:alkanesulfonate monooxygenase SsuD/methylene tetrahydromethanopterin reductase-like flavin-dependent oxidoreductase (luciferase family)|nr:5,10-methylene tetrahydromethanopterin reductase [Acidobacteriota bacterium]
MPKPSIGLVMGSAIAPEQLMSGARTAESVGFEEIWLAEDYFFSGGISGATMVLDVTNEIKVATGIVSAMVRHPAVLAMEISTLSRAHPGRFTAGIGLGVPAWLRQMGLHPPSSLAAMRECVESVKTLLEGQELSFDGSTFSFDKVKLTYPEDVPTPLHMGVSGPRMLQLSGRIADGTVLSVAASHDYVRWAKEQIGIGSREAGRTENHHITVFALYSVDEDPQVARDAVRGPLGFYKSHGTNALTDVYGNSAQVKELLAEYGTESLAEHMPNQWIEDLTIAGTPEECAEKIRAFGEAGADTVALFPLPTENIDDIIALTAREMLPILNT